MQRRLLRSRRASAGLAEESKARRGDRILVGGISPASTGAACMIAGWVRTFCDLYAQFDFPVAEPRRGRRMGYRLDPLGDLRRVLGRPPRPDAGQARPVLHSRPPEDGTGLVLR